jgi:hypothetical protein
VHIFGTPYLFGGISIAKTVTLHIRNPSPLSQFLTEITTFYYYNVILNNFKRGKSSSKAQIAAYLLTILAMAERGDLNPQVSRNARFAREIALSK